MSGWQFILLLARLHGFAAAEEAADRSSGIAKPAMLATLALTGIALGIGWILTARLDLHDDVEITAHRGASVAAPENSMAAFRAAIEAGPYVEMFRKKDIEIIYTMEPIDDFVLSHLGEFEGKKLVSADRADLAIPETEEEKKAEENQEAGLDSTQTEALLTWLKKILADGVQDVIISKRLVDAPAMIVNPDSHMTSSMQRVLAASRFEKGLGLETSKKNLEINLRNPLIKRLADLQEIIRTAAMASMTETYTYNVYKNAQAIVRLRNEFPRDRLTARAQRRVATYMTDMRAAFDLARRHAKLSARA